MANVRRTMRNVPSSNNNSSVKALVRRMIKSHDSATREEKRGIQYTSGTVAVAGTTFPLTQFIVQGNDVAQREGSEIIVQRMTMRFQLLTTGGIDVIRVIVFRDMDAQGALPTVGQVLDTGDPLSGFQLLYSQAKRFKILHDDLFGVDITGDNSSVVKKIDLKQNAKVNYYAATDIAGANGAGSYHVLIISQSNTLTTYSFVTEFHYYD